MEVSRLDLRPDTGPLPLAVLPNALPDNGNAPAPTLSAEASHSVSLPDSLPIVASNAELRTITLETSGARDGYGAVGAIACEGDGDDAPAAPACAPTANGLRVVPLANCSPIQTDSETLHADSDTQRTNPTGSHNPSSHRSPNPASGGKSGSRRGKRPSR